MHCSHIYGRQYQKLRPFPEQIVIISFLTGFLNTNIMSGEKGEYGKLRFFRAFPYQIVIFPFVTGYLNNNISPGRKPSMENYGFSGIFSFFTGFLNKYRVRQVKLHFLVLGFGGTPSGLGLPFFVRTTSIDT